MAEDAPLPEITINVKGPSELKLAVSISPSSTVAELKDKITAATEIEKERQRLIYSGKVLKDDDPLTTYKIQNNHSIHLVKSAAKTAPTASTSSSSPAAAATSESRGVPSNLNAGMQHTNNPLAQLEGVAGHGFGGGSYNPFLGMPGGDRNLADPNAMADMMNNPEMISQMMGMMTPEMIDQIIASNPQLSAMGPQVREMMNSPMMRQMLSDPQAIRQMMAMQNAMGGGGFPGLGGAGAAGGGAAPNPFARGFGVPPATPGQAPSPSAGAGAPPANPFAGMFGAGTGGLDPAMMQQLLGGGAGGGFGGGGGYGGAGGLGGFGSPPAQATTPALPADTRSIEERFQAQLLQLNEMGMTDPQQNIRALTMTGGNVEVALELIFSGRVPPSQ